MAKKKQARDTTTIEVSREIYVWLVSKKIHPNQSFNEVLENIKNEEGGRE